MSMDMTLSREGEFFPPEQQQQSPWAPLSFVWRRKWMTLFCVLVGLGGAYLQFTRETPAYQSTAEILIVRRQAKLPIEGVSIDTRYDETHELLLRSPVIVGQAVSKHKLDSLASLRASGNATGTVIGGLEVSGKGGPSGDVIRFGYSSSYRDDCPKILEAVIDAYRDFLGKTYEDISAELTDLINQAKDQLDQEITQAEEAYRKFRYDAPLIFSGDSAQNTHELLTVSIDRSRSEALLENTQLQAKIDGIEGALRRGANREALNLMIGHVTEKKPEAPPVADAPAEDNLLPLMLEEANLLEDFGPDHPKVKAIRRRIEMTRKHELFVRMNAEGNKAEGNKEATETRDFYQVYLESLREQIKMNERLIAELNVLFEEERKMARELSKFQLDDAGHRSQLARKEKMFEAIVNKLEEINVVKSAGGGVKMQIVHQPSAGVQIAPNMNRILTTGSLIGLMIGLGLAFVVDTADRRFRSPDDVRNTLGIPVLGHVPSLGIEKRSKKQQEEAQGIAALDPSLSTVHKPSGRSSEAYRAVRTAVYFSTRGAGHKVIQVTSANPGDGKTTLASNLAVCIAQAGKRTLLLDADFRRPRCHRLFNVPNDLGMSTAIEGKAELSDAIQGTLIKNLDLLTSGPRPANPSELLTSQRFADLLQVLREKYDVVIIDTPPVLAVTDPTCVAPRADGVLVVLRLKKDARSAAARTLETLDSLSANVLGVVVNGVGEFSRYGYGTTQYGPGYGYNYAYDSYRYGYGGYRYGYGEYGDESNSYYDEDTDQPHAVETNGNGTA